MPLKQGSSRGAASGGSDFEKLHFLENFVNLGEFLLRLSSRGLAGVLPPAGQIFGKWHFLENFVKLGEFFLCLSSRGLAEVLPPCPPVSLAGLSAGLSVSWP